MLNEVLENLLNDTVTDFINKVTSNQNDVRRWLGTKIDNQTLVLKDSKGNQTKQFEQAIKNHTLAVKTRNKDFYRKPN